MSPGMYKYDQKGRLVRDFDKVPYHKCSVLWTKTANQGGSGTPPPTQVVKTPLVSSISTQRVESPHPKPQPVDQGTQAEPDDGSETTIRNQTAPRTTTVKELGASAKLRAKVSFRDQMDTEHSYPRQSLVDEIDPRPDDAPKTKSDSNDSWDDPRYPPEGVREIGTAFFKPHLTFIPPVTDQREVGTSTMAVATVTARDDKLPQRGSTKGRYG